jgi:hypothetical protein
VSTTKDELRAEVAALREELAAERAKAEVLREQGHHCLGCGYGHFYYQHFCYQPYVPQPQPLIITCEIPQGTIGGTTTTWAQTSVAAGCAGAQTTLQLVSLGN